MERIKNSGAGFVVRDGRRRRVGGGWWGEGCELAEGSSIGQVSPSPSGSGTTIHPPYRIPSRSLRPGGVWHVPEPLLRLVLLMKPPGFGIPHKHRSLRSSIRDQCWSSGVGLPRS